NAAYEVESVLKDGIDAVWDSKMKLLKTELAAVLKELAPLLDENHSPASQTSAEPLSAGAALELFNKLEPMLENINPESADLLGEISAVPGTEELVSRIEDYDFEAAGRILAELKKKYEDK
ncbi:MAG: hypothetical protein FWH10_08085, partial [Oscillospiraceae bacterium]|nr:hypothetical protein [Oscillospiraceae bacterium]